MIFFATKTGNSNILVHYFLDINMNLKKKKKVNGPQHNYVPWIGMEHDLLVIEPHTTYSVNNLISFS